MVNKVILVGNVGIDPEVRTTESGVKVARIRLATTERLFDRQANETKEHTEWHTITLWRGLADVVDRYVRKGTQIYVEGRLRTREWMDKDNNKRYTAPHSAAQPPDTASPAKVRAMRSPQGPHNRRAADTVSRRSPSRPDTEVMRNRRSSSPQLPPYRQRIPTTCPSDGAARTAC